MNQNAKQEPLLPCPFCGGKATRGTRLGADYVQCQCHLCELGFVPFTERTWQFRQHPASTPADAPTTDSVATGSKSADATGEAGEGPTPETDVFADRAIPLKDKGQPDYTAALKEWNRFAEGQERTIATLRAECEGLRAWQPIDEAPKDRTWVLLAGRGYGWNEILQDVGAFSPTSKVWYGYLGSTPPFTPTHFRPLPSTDSIAASRGTEGVSDYDRAKLIHDQSDRLTALRNTADGMRKHGGEFMRLHLAQAILMADFCAGTWQNRKEADEMSARITEMSCQLKSAEDAFKQSAAAYSALIAEGAGSTA